MPFANRIEAARKLAARLSEHKGKNPLILAVPRGAVPMGKIIADKLQGQLDVVLVRKFGFPGQPEFALGAVTEDGEIHLGMGAERFGLNEQDVETAAMAEIEKMQKQRELFTPHHPPANPVGRTVIIVDDGIATGATMTAAIRSLQERDAGKIIIAVPVASAEAVRRLVSEGAEIVTLELPEDFYSVAQHYKDFTQVSDKEVIDILAFSAEPERIDVHIQNSDLSLRGFLCLPPKAKGLVIFAHGSGSGRFSPRNQFVSRILNVAGIATLLADLLEEHESVQHEKIFNVDLLANRLLWIADWTAENKMVRNLPLGYFGASTGAGAALQAAAMKPERIKAVVSRGGRPDLAMKFLEKVKAPTLLLVGEADLQVIELNKRAYAHLQCERSLMIIPHASHLFEEPGTLEEVARAASTWFVSHLTHAIKQHERGPDEIHGI